MRFVVLAGFLAAALTAQEPRAGKSVVVSWTASTTSGVDYYVYRDQATCALASHFVKINTITITTTSYTDTNVPDGTFCYYATAHTAAGGESVPSNKAETVISSPPNPPTNLTVNPATASLILNQKQQFTATRDTQTVKAAWSIDPPVATGTITQAGLYTAPSKIQGNNIVVQVLAKESGETATANVMIRRK